MGWFGKLTFGSLGLLLGGPLGAIAGAALGHHLVDKKEDGLRLENKTGWRPSFKYRDQVQAAYFVSMFSILGKMSKIDGNVSVEEISVVKGFIDHLPISEAEKQFAKQVFREAKDSPFSIDEFALQLHRILKNRPSVLLSFYDMLFKVAAADGKFHSKEEAALRRIKDIFNISELHYENIRSLYFSNLDKYYKLLNCSPENSDEEIKSSYKKLVKEFHPDVIVSKGLPEEFVDFASERFQEIQEAYENIRQERHF